MKSQHTATSYTALQPVRSFCTKSFQDRAPITQTAAVEGNPPKSGAVARKRSAWHLSSVSDQWTRQPGQESLVHLDRHANKQWSLPIESRQQ